MPAQCAGIISWNTMSYKRLSGRKYDQLRDMSISYNVFGYAPGSVLFELGNTKILCAVTLQAGVPPFLKGKKKGWLTAEYAMLPTSTHSRSVRDSSSVKKNDRSVEISRLIGRSLRAVVNLDLIGERTIHIDCDVLQADGSTRTACITGAYKALQSAVQLWLAQGDITQTIITGAVAAVSVGILNGQPLLDLDYQEDSIIDADYNFVLTDAGTIVEIQGTAEKQSLSWQEFDAMAAYARLGVNQLFEHAKKTEKSDTLIKKAPLFSLQNRLSA